MAGLGPKGCWLYDDQEEDEEASAAAAGAAGGGVQTVRQGRQVQQGLAGQYKHHNSFADQVRHAAPKVSMGMQHAGFHCKDRARMRSAPTVSGHAIAWGWSCLQLACNTHLVEGTVVCTCSVCWLILAGTVLLHASV